MDNNLISSIIKERIENFDPHAQPVVVQSLSSGSINYDVGYSYKKNLPKEKNYKVKYSLIAVYYIDSFKFDNSTKRI